MKLYLRKCYSSKKNIHLSQFLNLFFIRREAISSDYFCHPSVLYDSQRQLLLSEHLLSATLYYSLTWVDVSWARRPGWGRGGERRCARCGRCTRTLVGWCTSHWFLIIQEQSDSTTITDRRTDKELKISNIETNTCKRDFSWILQGSLPGNCIAYKHKRVLWKMLEFAISKSSEKHFGDFCNAT